jgi:DNA-binding NtrC family response regulator
MPLREPACAPRDLLPQFPEDTGPTRELVERPAFGRLGLVLPDGGHHAICAGVTIGQSPGNDVVLQDPSVSRRHCVIEAHRERFIVRDLESTNGTIINGVRAPKAELRPGATLMLGKTRLRVTEDQHSEGSILGDSLAVHRLRKLIALLATSNMPVLIHGETGTGKELVALSLHEQSGRLGAFVPVNCGAIPKELIESELFGHERGAFTGANTRREGLFQAADGGTLFLDEIGELPAALQSRLLRALETRAIRPVGCNREMPVNVRTIAATHVDLKRAVAAGGFRRDLYFRLAVAEIPTPPLRARPGDIRLLAQHALAELAASGVRPTLSEQALLALEQYDWPGNVRELKNAIWRAVTFGGGVLWPKDLQLGEATRLEESQQYVKTVGRSLEEIYRDVILQALHRCGGNQSMAAKELNIARSSLNDKLHRYGITIEEQPRRAR